MGAARFTYLSIRAWSRFKNGGALPSSSRTSAVSFIPVTFLLRFRSAKTSGCRIRGLAL